MKPYDLALSALRSAPVTAIARRLTGSKLRILAYHGVGDAQTFARQMEYLASAYTPVDEQAVIAAVRHGAPLPDGAAWVTFDDGDPTVVQDGLPTLARLGIPATMFVCPGLIADGRPFWWNVTDWATDHRPDLAASIAGSADALTAFVKTVPDEERRRVIDRLLHEVGHDMPTAWRQLTDSELRSWLDAGMALGNHSWDHPCLDQCDVEVQRAQIVDTHSWLARLLGRPPATFAYPNGNFSPVVDAVLAELNYQLGVLYDNSLTSLDSPPLQLSRLMLEADQPADRLKGVLSGAQPTLAGLGSRIATRRI